MRVSLTSLVYGKLVVTVTLIYNFVVIWPNVLSHGFIKKKRYRGSCDRFHLFPWL